MNYTSLKYFIVAADELNITKAASRLYISQQSLSEHIARLEKEYGVILFERTPRLKLTYAGRLMYSFAERAIRLDNELNAQMADISSQKKGSLSVGMPPAHGRALGPDLFAAFHKRYPNIDLHITIANSSRMITQLLDGDLDIAICFNYDAINPRIEKIPLLNENFALVIPEEILLNTPRLSENIMSDNFDPAFLEDTPIIMSTEESAVQSTIMNYLQRNNIHCKKVIGSIRDHQARLLLCSKGLGVTITFQSVAENFIESYRTPQKMICIPLPLTAQLRDNELMICYLHDHYLSNAGGAFIRIAQQIHPGVR